ncbi:CpXC domain-containing protein [Solobacterium moorei]|uniref:CpXC domain-containing protein n=1 Tax=Solobacterium moorei F0204 TaxID=706433 RepID=E7MKM2_9FIRM|nr:CpXC domain-containing protein [Solobacterium moorei]EFW25297.1 hypothetical protein HMPREF9430_00067 [Solobacterium moorei F0204]MDI6415091.1 CpXC domain-containing protein [Solobacterium moorei]
MSQSQDIRYTCPYCHKEFDTTIYTAINAEQDPDLKEACISGDIFRYTCPHCQHAFMIQPPLVYSDPSRKFLIWLSQQAPAESLKQLALPLAKQGFKLRRCATVQEFAEKIQIFEDGVDDIMVELAKYDSFIEYIDNKKGTAEDVTGIEYQHTENDVMKINVRADDKGMSFLIPVSVLEEEMKVDKDRFAIDETDFPRINNDWIISAYTEAAGKA